MHTFSTWKDPNVPETKRPVMKYSKRKTDPRVPLERKEGEDYGQGETTWVLLEGNHPRIFSRGIDLISGCYGEKWDKRGSSGKNSEEITEQYVWQWLVGGRQLSKLILSSGLHKQGSTRFFKYDQL